MSQPIDSASVAIVADFSRFATDAKAGIGTALRGVTTTAKDAFGQVESAAATTGRKIGAAFQAGGEAAERALDELKSRAKIVMADVAATTDKASAALAPRMVSALTLVKGALVGVAIGIGAGLAAMTGFGLKSAASLEQTQIGFESLLGSAQEAKTFLVDLQKFSAETPFEFQGVADASRRLLVLAQSMGQTKDAVIPMLTTIGNLVSVVGGTQESIDSVVRALSQMASKGKVSQEEIMQLAEALPGFNANAAIASQLGLSVADTLDLITAGGVDATTGINALLAGMQAFPGAAGAMVKQSQTLLGVFSTFKDTIGIALTGAFQPVIPEIKNSLAELTPVLGDAIGQLAPTLGKAVAGILPLLGKVVSMLVPILTPILTALGPALDALGPALQPLGEAIGQVLVALGPILPIVAEFIAVLAQLAVPVLLLLATVLKPLTPLLNFMAEAIGELSKALAMIDWTAVGKAIADAFITAWHWVEDVFKKIGKWFDDIPGIATHAFQAMQDTIMERVAAMLTFVQSIPAKIVDGIGQLGGLLIQAGKDAIFGLWTGISSLGGWLWQKVKDFAYNNTVGAMKTALGIASPSTVMAEQVGRWIPPGIGEGMKDTIPDLQALIGSIVPAGNTATAGPTLGGIVVNVMFSGVVPSEADARRTGTAAGAGVADALTRRGIALAVRQA